MSNRFVALSVLASGPVPWRDQLLALAAVRFQGRRVEARFSALVRPSRRPSQAILAALGASDDELEGAPRFVEIAPSLREFLEADTLVGFGIKVTLEFLAAELSRINAPGMDNPLLELAELADRSGIRLGKPGLAQLAMALDLNPAPPGDTATIARVTAQVAARLLDQDAPTPEAGVAGIATNVPDRWALLDPARIRGVAETPGVYVLRGQGGEVLYAGAAGNLRRRLATYQSHPLELERRLEGLSERVWDIETRPANGFLEALLDEAQVISEHAPPFNTQRLTHMPRRFIRASVSARPGMRLVAEVQSDGAVYVGPFVSASQAARALSLVRQVFPILGRRGAAQPRQRPTKAERVERESGLAQAVRDGVALLSGQREAALRLLRDRSRAARAEGHFQDAEHWRRLAGEVADFDVVPSPLRDGPRARFAVLLMDALGEPWLAYHIAAGNVLERCELRGPAQAEELLNLWRDATPHPPLREEAIPLIMRWLALQGARVRVVLLPDPW